MFKLNPIKEALFEGFFQRITYIDSEAEPMLWGGDGMHLFSGLSNAMYQMPYWGGLSIGARVIDNTIYFPPTEAGLIAVTALSMNRDTYSAYSYRYDYQVSTEVIKDLPQRPPVGSIHEKIVDKHVTITGRDWRMSHTVSSRVELYYGSSQIIQGILPEPVVCKGKIAEDNLTIDHTNALYTKDLVFGSTENIGSNIRGALGREEWGDKWDNLWIRNSVADHVIQYGRSSTHSNSEMVFMAGDQEFRFAVKRKEGGNVNLQLWEQNTRVGVVAQKDTDVGTGTRHKLKKYKFKEEVAVQHTMRTVSTHRYRSNISGWETLTSETTGGEGGVEKLNDHANARVAESMSQINVPATDRLPMTADLMNPVLRKPMGLKYDTTVEIPWSDFGQYHSRVKATGVHGVLQADGGSGGGYEGMPHTVEAKLTGDYKKKRLMPFLLRTGYRTLQPLYTWGGVYTLESSGMKRTYVREPFSFFVRGAGIVDKYDSKLNGFNQSLSRFPLHLDSIYPSATTWDETAYVLSAKVVQYRDPKFGCIGWDVIGTLGNDRSNPTKTWTGMFLQIRFAAWYRRVLDPRATSKDSVYQNFSLEFKENISVDRGELFNVERTLAEWDAFFDQPQDGSPEVGYEGNFRILATHVETTVFKETTSESQLEYPDIGGSFEIHIPPE